MGKKSKRKAAKATAATGAHGANVQLGPRFDGVLCTNVDPKLCAICSVVMPKGTPLANICCGTRTCSGCSGRVHGKCSFCHVRSNIAHQGAFLAKKRAKEGFSWASHSLAEIYRRGFSPWFPQSDCMAFRLHEKAAAKDHPVSCCELASFYKHGVGCKKNLEKARIMFEKAMHLHAEEYVINATHLVLLGHSLALSLVDRGETGKGLSILLPLAERGNAHAQCSMSSLCGHVGDMEGRMRWTIKCSESCSDDRDDSFPALDSAMRLRDYCLSRHWYAVTSKIDQAAMEDYEAVLVKDAHDVLCDIRRECAWCHCTLDRSIRKMCQGCKAHCYCSKDCQKAHWNAEVNDHRSECKNAMVVKKKIAAK